MLRYCFSQWWNFPYKDHIKNVNNIGQNLKEIKNSPFWHCRSLCEQLPSWLPTLCFHSTGYGDWSRTLDTLDDERQMIFYNTNNENQNYSLINCDSHPLIKINDKTWRQQWIFFQVLDGFTRKDLIGQEGKLRTEHISQVKWSWDY